MPANGFAEAWYWVRLVEASNASTAVTATISLDVPAGVDFDLFVYCFTCGGTLAGESKGGIGVDEVVQVSADEDFGEDDSYDVLIEVRFVNGSGASCGNWSLSVVGNTGAPAQTCDP